MTRNALKLSYLIALGLFTLAAPAANAQTITANLTTPTPLKTINYTFNGSDTSGQAGRLVLTQTNPVNPVLPQSFEAYCVELTQFAADPSTLIVDSTVNLVSPSVGGKIAWLYNTYATPAISSINAAALQIAIWEIRYDLGTLNVDNTGGTGGNFYVRTGFSDDTAIISQAKTYLNSIGSNTSQASWLRNNDTQDFVGPNRVPEPGAFALLAAGLPLLGLLRRRK